MQIPDTHQTLMPYLILPNAAGFLEFLEEVFDGKETLRKMRDEKTIMHAECRVNGATIMVADANSNWEPNTGSHFIYVPDADKAFKKAIEKGSEVLMEMSDQNYGRSGGVKDPFGNIWWITSL